MSDPGQDQNIEFTVDTENLYREESFTDLKVGSIRRLVPVTPDIYDPVMAELEELGIGFKEEVHPL